MTSKDSFSKTIKMEVFEDRKNVLHRKIKTKNGIKRQESDHNNILTQFDINFTKKHNDRR